MAPTPSLVVTVSAEQEDQTITILGDRRFSDILKILKLLIHQTYTLLFHK